MDYFERLLELLKMEREEDRKVYQKLIETSSVAERRANGLSWYPIAIRGTELGRGDYLSVEVERTTHLDINHQLRFGVSAVLFSQHDAKNNRVEGTVTHQSGNGLVISLRTDELPDWASDGKLGIDLLFDDNSYDEMQNALRMAAALEKKDESHLIKILTGQESPIFNLDKTLYAVPDFNTSQKETAQPVDLIPVLPVEQIQNNLTALITQPFVDFAEDTKPLVKVTLEESIHLQLKTSQRLNASQQEAVNKILSANDLVIVHGPPGTGKTTTLVQAIKALLKQDHQQILVVAPSNTAVDLLSEKLADERLNVLRIGNPSRVSEHLMSLTLDSKMAEHASMKTIKNLKKRANEFRNMAHKYKRNFGKAEREQRKALFDEAYKIMKEVGNTEEYIINDILAKAQVITATLVGANHYTVRNLKYHTIVIDEAGQALEPACWIPILKAQKVVLAGDHNQLSPTIKSKEAAQGGLSITLLEKCVALHPQSVVLLEEQYRMHETIMGYSSRVFYGNKLKAHSSVARHLLFPGEAPLSFIDTAGCGFEEKKDGTSTSNPEEAVFLLNHLTVLVTALSAHYTADDFPSIAVISPYKQQIYQLNELLLHSPALLTYRSKISVNTIDSFQGQERDVVYISMTRSNTNGEIGFLSDTRRMNVAMTRARKKLVVIGDSATLSKLKFYADFIEYAQSVDAYQSAWDFVD